MEPVVHLRGAVALLGRFPALAGVDLDVAAGEIVLLRGPNGAGKTTLLRSCAGLAARRPGEAGCSATTSPTAARPGRCAAGSACSATPPASTTTSPWPTTCASGVGPPARAPADSTPPLAACGLDGRLADVPSPGCRPASAAAPSLACLRGPPPRAVAARRAPRRARPGRPRPGRRAGAPGRRPPAPPSLLASHELDRAEALADRVVTIVGRHHRRRRRPPTPTAEEPVLVP